MPKQKYTPPRPMPVHGPHKIAVLLAREGHVSLSDHKEDVKQVAELKPEQAGVFFAHWLFHRMEASQQIAS